MNRAATLARRPATLVRRPLRRALGWLVTGPLGRGISFALDFGAALRTMLARRFL